MNDRI